MDRSTETSQTAHTGSSRDRGQHSNTEPESSKAQISVMGSGLGDALKSEHPQYISDALRAIREGQTFTYSNMLDAMHKLLVRVRCLEENPGHNRDDVAALRGDFNTVLESKPTLTHKMDLRFSRVVARLRKS